MKTLNLILGCLILAALFIPLALHAGGFIKLPTSMRQIKRAFGYPAGQLAINALGDATHPDGILSLRADAAIATRYFLVKRGSDAAHAAVCAAAADQPLGLATDEADAAEDPVAVRLLGAGKGTVLMVAGETITADEDVYSKGDGKIMDEPAVAGTYWKVGRAVTAGTADVEMEVEPCIPQKVIVIANAANLATTQAAMVNAAHVIVLGA